MNGVEWEGGVGIGSKSIYFNAGNAENISNNSALHSKKNSEPMLSN
jgi:hypothetical protein